MSTHGAAAIAAYPGRRLSSFATPSREPRLRLPWLLGTFILSVFACTNPWNSARANGSTSTLNESIQLVETGSRQREIGLLCLALLALGVFWGRRSVRLRIKGLLPWALIAYAALATLSALWAQDPTLAVRREGVLICLLLGAVGVAARCSYLEVGALTVFGGTVTLLISLVVEIFTGNFHPTAGDWRFSGMLYSVSQGWNCGITTIAAMFLAWNVPRGRKSLMLLAFVSFVFLVLTKSRMPLISTVAALCVLGLFTSAKSRITTFVAAYALLIAAVLFTFGLSMAGQDVGTDAQQAAALGRGADTVESFGTFTGRKELWDAELAYARRRPVLGYGYDAFFTADNLTAISATIGWIPASAHSAFLATLLGLGYSGVVLLAIVILTAVLRALRLAHGNPRKAFAAAAMVWMCANLFLESSLITDPTFPTFICFIVLTSLAFKDHSHEQRHTPQLRIA